MAEQPRQRKRSNQLHRVIASAAARGNICGLEMQTRPEQLGPGCVVNHARSRADQSFDAAWRGERSTGVKSAREPAPLLTVTEELPWNAEICLLGGSGERLPQALLNGVLCAGIGTDVESTNRRNVRGADLARPVSRFQCLGLLAGQPAANLEQNSACRTARAEGQRRGRLPALNPRTPGRRHAHQQRRRCGRHFRWIQHSKSRHCSLHLEKRCVSRRVDANAEFVEYGRTEVRKTWAAIMEE